MEAIAAIVSQVNPRLGSNRAGSKNANANANVNVGGAGCAGLLFVFPNMLVCCSFDWGNLGNLGNLVLGEGDCSCGGSFISLSVSQSLPHSLDQRSTWSTYVHTLGL